MGKFKCPICGCEELQEIQDIHAAYYLPENVVNGVRGQESIYVNQYVCTKCGFLYQIVNDNDLVKIRTLYANTHNISHESGNSYQLNFDAINKCNQNN
ncbi:hypothetical protein [Caproicibacter fermentans]|uniref:hypothetical protein n=1 Tax=Caproicibacter fermentans TaxID=2576756 RepID=UPI0012ED04F3|nr:hypothetical protein [Caproicibacter fermentans]